jgi:hypothetical protein
MTEDSFSASYWIPASAGMTEDKLLALWVKHRSLNLMAVIHGERGLDAYDQKSSRYHAGFIARDLPCQFLNCPIL